MVDSKYRELVPKVALEDADAARPSGRNLVKVLSATMIALALVVGVGVRVVWLDKMPPALHQDEACDGYDAYSILTTGRDHHGNFMPIVMQGFNDYRMPLLQYSLVPLVGVFGLKTKIVRLGAALWGTLDLAAIACLAGLMLGWPGAAAAAVLAALSPWHLAFSRFGQEAITASATITLAIACFFAWLRWGKTRYLIVSAVFLGTLAIFLFRCEAVYATHHSPADCLVQAGTKAGLAQAVDRIEHSGSFRRAPGCDHAASPCRDAGSISQPVAVQPGSDLHGLQQ